MKFAIGLLFTLLLLYALPVSAQDAAQGGSVAGQIVAGGPVITPELPVVPSHEPAHVARVQDLDVRVAAGEATDPLAGNRTLLTSNKIMVAWHGLDPAHPYCTKPYDVDANLGSLVAKTRVCESWGSGMQASNTVDVAAGHLVSSSPFVDAVTVGYFGDANTLQFFIRRYDSTLKQQVNTAYTLDGSAVKQASCHVMAINRELCYGGIARVNTGDFDGDGWDEFVIGWESTDGKYQLQWFKPARDTYNTVYRQGLISPGVLGGARFLDVATGDFNGDGVDEIATGWSNSEDGLVVDVYSVTADGKLVLKSQYTESVAFDLGRIVTSVGDFNADGIDEIAVGFNTQVSTGMYVLQATNNLATLARRAGTAFNSNSNRNVMTELVERSLGLAAGDFNGDGDDELALASPNQDVGSAILAFTIFDADSAFSLTQKIAVATTNGSPYEMLVLRAGDLNGDGLEELVLGAADFHSVMGYLSFGVIQVAPDLLTLAEKGKIGDEQVNIGSLGDYGWFGFALGPYDGETVYVGAPTYHHQTSTLQNIAVINAPPKHRDEIDVSGVITEVDVNVEDTCYPLPCTYAKYQNESGSSTSMSVSSNRDWSVSAEAEVKIPHLKSSMEATYGQSFEKTTTSFKSMEFGLDVDADTDDAIIRLQQDLDIWEYPVYADCCSNVVQGYILVTWPVKADPTCTSNCAAALTARIDGMNPASAYLPNHEWGNVLSYSTQAPGDISTTIKSDYVNYLGTNSTEMYVKWSDVQDSEEKKSSSLDLKESLTVSGWGQKLTTSGSYAQGDVSVNKTGFEASTALHVRFWGIAQKYSYSVRPFMYWAKPDGHLVLDYSVALPDEPQSWWRTTYNKPDPTFNLPWKDGSMGAYYQDLTREITFNPITAAANQDVIVTAKVRNYSPVGAGNVLVRFYMGDPKAGGVQIGQVTIAMLAPLSYASVSTTFNTGGHSDGEELEIYAVVDPNNTIAEMHEEYNTAYAVLPIKAATAGAAPGLRTLSLSADDIAVAPGAEGTMTISATVRARNGTFVWVTVDFWDGMPLHGGRLIGSGLLPVIADGQAKSVAVKWSTVGTLGTHAIWVGVLPNTDDQVMNDNYAHTEVEFGPYRAILPLIYK